MSGGANKAFLANTLNWMRNNVLIVDIQSGATGAGDAGYVLKYKQGAVVTVDIDRDASLNARRTGGGTVPVYRVREAAGTANMFSNRFNAYYLPFFANDFRTMTLDPNQFPPGAVYFFTDTVNGCSFAAGPGQNPKVGHFNRTVGGLDPGAAIDQAAMNHDIAFEFHGGTDVKLTKATYKPGTPDYATVFGIRNAAGWDFYWQGPRTWVGMVNNEKEFQVPAAMLAQCDNNG